ncbi:L7Ae/L30e/S12e/Gadd45 family ribosomal protein [Pediococcus siamensis]|uniref:L7Ae/L30e/S12e/Gadd45 family ribosomal protein n=1 Tax=Pediococcus siamensis TaxID=381829 RepID=UPI0039A31303
MNNEQRFINLLGLAQRAGKLITGEAQVLQSIRGQKAKLVVISTDIGQATRKKISDKCTTYQVSLLTFMDRNVLSQAIGQPRTAVAIEDQGFAKALLKLNIGEGA